jgi:predicted transcriptional regulator
MDSKLIELTADVVTSYVEHNAVPASDLPGLIKSVHDALSGVGAPEPEASEAVKLTPAQIRKSITPDFLISFVDGKKYKSLKRHLGAHGLTFQDYRAKFGLPKDYPTVAPSYSAQRSEMAKQLGLGQKAAAKKAPAPKKTSRARKPS